MKLLPGNVTVGLTKGRADYTDPVSSKNVTCGDEDYSASFIDENGEPITRGNKPWVFMIPGEVGRKILGEEEPEPEADDPPAEDVPSVPLDPAAMSREELEAEAYRLNIDFDDSTPEGDLRDAIVKATEPAQA